MGETLALGELVATWGLNHSRAGLYVSEFNKGPTHGGTLTAALWDSSRSINWFDNTLASRNLLVGGLGSGLPFHRHQRTWQMLFAGTKEWFLLPPGPFPEALSKIVGPYIFPVRFERACDVVTTQV